MFPPVLVSVKSSAVVMFVVSLLSAVVVDDKSIFVEPPQFIYKLSSPVIVVSLVVASVAPNTAFPPNCNEIESVLFKIVVVAV